MAAIALLLPLSIALPFDVRLIPLVSKPGALVKQATWSVLIALRMSPDALSTTASKTSFAAMEEGTGID